MRYHCNENLFKKQKQKIKKHSNLYISISNIYHAKHTKSFISIMGCGILLAMVLTRQPDVSNTFFEIPNSILTKHEKQNQSQLFLSDSNKLHNIIQKQKSRSFFQTDDTLKIQANQEDIYTSKFYNNEDVIELLASANNNYINKTTEQNTSDENMIPDINFDEDVSEHSKEVYYQYLAYEPQEILNAIAIQQIPINIAPNGKYTDHHAGAYKTNFDNSRSINLNCDADYQLSIAVNHEIGHCIDELAGQVYNLPCTQTKNPAANILVDDTSVFISNCDEFQEIYEAEAETSGYNPHDIENPAEFFAETYRFIVEQNTGMLAKNPRATEFVINIVNKIYGTNLQQAKQL